MEGPQGVWADMWGRSRHLLTGHIKQELAGLPKGNQESEQAGICGAGMREQRVPGVLDS